MANLKPIDVAHTYSFHPLSLFFFFFLVTHIGEDGVPQETVVVALWVMK
jgi:hypothetical protein